MGMLDSNSSHHFQKIQTNFSKYLHYFFSQMKWKTVDKISGLISLRFLTFCDLSKHFYGSMYMGSWWAHRWYVRNFIKHFWESYRKFKSEMLICDFSRCGTWAKQFYDSMHLVSSWAKRWLVRKLEIALWESSRTFNSKILICDLRLYLTWAKLFKGWANLGKIWAKLWRMSF